MDEDLMEEDYNMDNKTLLERLVLNCVHIPGTRNYDPEMRVIVYDYDNENVKINEERLSVGIAYVIMGRIELQSWFSIKDYSKLFYPNIPLEGFNLYAINKHFIKNKVRIFICKSNSLFF